VPIAVTENDIVAGEIGATIQKSLRAFGGGRLSAAGALIQPNRPLVALNQPLKPTNSHNYFRKDMYIPRFHTVPSLYVYDKSACYVVTILVRQLLWLG
jgi:hypothetical protein